MRKDIEEQLPSAAEGLAAIFYIGDVLRLGKGITQQIGVTRESAALQNDWKAIGGDFWRAIHMYDRELKQQKS